jgi:hypothetical protein
VTGVLNSGGILSFYCHLNMLVILLAQGERWRADIASLISCYYVWGRKVLNDGTSALGEVRSFLYKINFSRENISLLLFNPLLFIFLFTTSLRLK